jgi:hypothetical protein
MLSAYNIVYGYTHTGDSTKELNNAGLDGQKHSIRFSAYITNI